MALLVWFQPGRTDLDIARALRGGPVFDILEKKQELYPGLKFRIILAQLGSIAIPAHGSRGQDAIFAPLQTLCDTPELLDRIIETSANLIVDVHFPLPSPDKMLAIQNVPEGGERDAELDEVARNLWRDPVRVEQAYKVLRTADLVTVSPAGSFDPERAGHHDAVYLPDVKTVNDAVTFYRKFVESLWLLQTTSTGLRRTWARFALSLTTYIASRDLKRIVEIPDTP